MEKTIEYWKAKIAERIKEHDFCFLEHWEDEDSYEIYTTDEMDEALVGAETIRQWDKDFSDENGRNYMLHLYAYVKGAEVEYEGVLYDDIEKGSNEYAELNMDENFRKALTQFIRSTIFVRSILKRRYKICVKDRELKKRR